MTIESNVEEIHSLKLSISKDLYKVVSKQKFIFPTTSPIYYTYIPLKLNILQLRNNKDLMNSRLKDRFILTIWVKIIFIKSNSLGNQQIGTEKLNN